MATHLYNSTGNIAPAGSYRELREKGLLASAKRGQTAAFEELCQPFAARIFRTTYRITRNREDAEDALQDSFLRAFVHIKEFDGRSSFSTWFTRIAINSALMILRKGRTRPEIPSDDPSNLGFTAWCSQVADTAPNPEKHYLQQERARVLRRAIRTLRPTHRGALEIRQLQEYSIKETAQMIGISVSTVKGRLFHAKVALRKVPSLRTIGSTTLNYRRT